MLAAALRQHERQVRLSATALTAARGAWRLLDRHALDATAGRLLGRLLPALGAVQLSAATAGAAYVAAALAEQGIDVDALGEVIPEALAGIASDGRPLETLLTVPVRTARHLTVRGAPPSRAMSTGLAQLERIVVTQVADAARVAEGVGVVARPRVGYVRMLNPPACSRCIVLAGRWYRYSTGFARHPQCQCIHIPAAEDTADDFRTEPRQYFDSLSASEQDRIFGRAGAEAIRDGADISQVVNARRGMHTAGGRRHTRESTTRRGRAGPGRLMPEQIYRDATSRDEAVSLLRTHGYLR